MVNNAFMLLPCGGKLESAHDAKWKGGRGKEGEERSIFIHLPAKGQFTFLAGDFFFGRLPNKNSLSLFP